MDADTLRQYLEFYQDLHIQTLYRRSVASPPTAQTVVSVAQWETQITPTISHAPQAPFAISEPPPMELPPLAPPNESLLSIIQDIGDCRRCREARHPATRLAQPGGSDAGGTGCTDPYKAL